VGWRKGRVEFKLKVELKVVTMTKESVVGKEVDRGEEEEEEEEEEKEEEEEEEVGWLGQWAHCTDIHIVHIRGR
jgi:hypothetical protein